MPCHILRALTLGVVSFSLLGCPTGKQLSVGGESATPVGRSTPELSDTDLGTADAQVRSGNRIKVMLVSYDRALDIAREVIKLEYPAADIEEFDDGFVFVHYGGLLGSVQAKIKPKLVKEAGPTGRTGITYETEARGYGVNAAYFPGYVTSGFNAELERYRTSRKIEIAEFEKFVVSEDRGVTDSIPHSVPTAYDEFARYLDKKGKLGRFEGIWSDHSGRNVLGIVAAPDDELFNYKAFVITSKESNWKPGDVKIKFTRLRVGRPTVSRYWASDKRQSGVTWRAGADYIQSIHIIDEPRRATQVALIKTYPTERTSETTGVGTGWAVSRDGVFATNHHVIDGATDIWVGFREGKPKKAQVVAVDERVDLALIRIEKPDRPYRPIPLANGRAANGSAITVIGYPLAFRLGDDPRVTNGVISAQKGIDSDITRYQISAAVQPGNSGGPVLNARAEVVGVVVEKTRIAEAENVGFAVKVGYLKLLLESAGIAPASGRSDGARSPKDLFEIFGESVLPVWTKN